MRNGLVGRTTLLFIFISLTSLSGLADATPDPVAPIDQSRCFAGVIQDSTRGGGTVSLQYLLEDCFDAALGQSRTSGTWQSSFRHLFAELPADSPIRTAVSAKAAEIYYNDDLYCNHNGSSTFAPPNNTHTSCNNVFRVLAQLDPENGMYQYICHSTADPSNCPDMWGAIAPHLNGCDEDNEHKSYCHRLVRGFLTRSQECSGGNTSACTNHVTQRMSQDICSFENLDLDMCIPNTASVRGAGLAEADDDEDTNPAPEAGPGEVTGGDNSPPEETPTTEDEEDLIAAMDQAAADTFGGMPGNFRQASLDATTQVPGVNVNAPGGGDISAAGRGGQVGGFNPGSSTAIPGAARLAPPTRGAPGGSPKNIGAPGGAGGAPGAGAGGVAGGGGLGNQGGGARGGGRRRGGGASVYNRLAKNMNSGFMGTDGPGASSSGGAAAIKESPVDKRIKKAIADNKKNNLDKAALQKALDKNLNTPGGRQELVLRSSYFPSHSEVYLWLHQRSDILDESGE